MEMTKINVKYMVFRMNSRTQFKRPGPNGAFDIAISSMDTRDAQSEYAQTEFFLCPYGIVAKRPGWLPKLIVWSNLDDLDYEEEAGGAYAPSDPEPQDAVASSLTPENDAAAEAPPPPKNKGGRPKKHKPEDKP